MHIDPSSLEQEVKEEFSSWDTYASKPGAFLLVRFFPSLEYKVVFGDGPESTSYQIYKDARCAATSFNHKKFVPASTN